MPASRSPGALPPIGLAYGEHMASSRMHAGQGPVLRGGCVMGDGFWPVRGPKARPSDELVCSLPAPWAALRRLPLADILNGISLLDIWVSRIISPGSADCRFHPVDKGDLRSASSLVMIAP